MKLLIGFGFNLSFVPIFSFSRFPWGVLKTKILKGKSMNLNWNFPMKGKIGGKLFKCQSSMFARTLPRNRVQVCSSPWAIYR